MKKDPFFTLSEDSTWNALIGRQGNKFNYADGYIEAAVDLSKGIIEQKKFGQRDTLCLPILYNARHSIELHLKIVIGSFTEAGVVKSKHDKNHDIKSHFEFLIDAQIEDECLRGILESLRPYLESLSQVDDDGQQFRYHETRDGERSLDGKSLINIKVLYDGLLKLKTILDELKYRSDSYVSEFKTGTNTSRLSREDLYKIAKLLPLRSNWDNSDFDKVKEKIKVRFNLSNRQFSKAIDVIESQRELGSIIGIETKAKFITDDKAFRLCEGWCGAHSEVERDPCTSVNFSDKESMRKAFVSADIFEKSISKISDDFDLNEAVDVETIFYMARDHEYVEYYEDRFQTKLKARSGPRERLAHVLEKTNFLQEFSRGVRRIGRVNLADKLDQMLTEFQKKIGVAETLHK
ncbi:hypothetical protein [Thalassospira sp. CH_XMU1448-2]|uniref:hypothetical protein n=1 Tax=Thalassospira sp. CH_XMU1448-2 TaxID=3107773 RepID=UPI00300BF8D5